jgi:hypothetical protein
MVCRERAWWMAAATLFAISVAGWGQELPPTEAVPPAPQVAVPKTAPLPPLPPQAPLAPPAATQPVAPPSLPQKPRPPMTPPPVESVPPIKKGASSAKKVSDMALEELLHHALRSHADILSAQSKVRDAEIELIRVKQKILVQIATHRAEYELAKSVYSDAKAKLARSSQLLASKAISMEESRLIESEVVKAKAELDRAEAVLAGAAGVAPAGYSEFNIVLVENPLGTMMRVYPPVAPAAPVTPGVVDPPRSMQGAPPAVSSKAMDKLLKSLATPVELSEVKLKRLHAGLGAVLLSLREQTGIDFILTMDDVNAEKMVYITRPMPFGACLQWVEDTYKVRFIARDYGIVVTSPDNSPPGAIFVMDVWRRSELSLQSGMAPTMPPTRSAPK